MASPVICIRDTSVANDTFQITDLFPNRSQRNGAIDPVAQGPRYLRNVETQTPVVSGTSFARSASGLVAYLLANQCHENAPNFEVLSVVEATTLADFFVARMRDGLALDLATVNPLIAGLAGLADVQIGSANSSTTIHDVLLILSGAKYTVPAGHVYKAGNDDIIVPTESFFNTSVFVEVDEDDSSFYLSVARGALSKAKSVRTNPVDGSLLDPLVVVYDGAGNVL